MSREGRFVEQDESFWRRSCSAWCIFRGRASPGFSAMSDNLRHQPVEIIGPLPGPCWLAGSVLTDVSSPLGLAARVEAGEEILVKPREWRVCNYIHHELLCPIYSVLYSSRVLCCILNTHHRESMRSSRRYVFRRDRLRKSRRPLTSGMRPEDETAVAPRGP